jgi:hypothetical protein
LSSISRWRTRSAATGMRCCGSASGISAVALKPWRLRFGDREPLDSPSRPSATIAAQV